MPLYSATGHLDPIPPFDFVQSLRFLSGFRPAQGEQTVIGQTLTRAVMVAGQPVAFRVTATGTLAAPRLDYTLFAMQPIAPATQAAAADRIAFFLSLNDDLAPFYAIGRADPAFAPIITQLYGYHQVKFVTPFEAACWAVISQRNIWSVSQRMKQALTERFGASVSVESTVYGAFPEADALAGANPDDVLAAIRNERKAEYVRTVAQAFRRVDEGWLRAAPAAEVEAWLLRIPGIGAWSAGFILLRGLGRPDRLPPGEKRLLEAARRIYGGPLTEADLARLAAPYGPWPGYWAHYLRAAS